MAVQSLCMTLVDMMMHDHSKMVEKKGSVVLVATLGHKDRPTNGQPDKVMPCSETCMALTQSLS